jgi:hypothetical protein
MISLIETGPFKQDAGGVEDSPNMIATFWANLQRLIGHFLPHLKTVAACLAEILIRWHLPITSHFTFCKQGYVTASVTLLIQYSSLILARCQSPSVSASTHIPRIMISTYQNTCCDDIIASSSKVGNECGSIVVVHTVLQSGCVHAWRAELG